MPKKTVEVDPEEVKGAWSKVTGDMLKSFTLQNVNVQNFKASYFHIVIMVILVFISNYLAYVAGTLLRLKIVTAIFSIIVPVFPIFGLVYTIAYAFVAAGIYAHIYNDTVPDVKTYMYIVLLGGVHLPIAIVLINFAKGMLRGILGPIYQIIYILCFGFITAYSEHFCRTHITGNRRFESAWQQNMALGISILLNLGAYFIFYPLFYIH